MKHEMIVHLYKSWVTVSQMLLYQPIQDFLQTFSIKSIVFWVFEDVKIKISEGYKQNLELYFNFQNDIELEAFFIDAKYEADETSLGKEKFDEYTGKLWDFASNIDPFPMKDIEVVLNEYHKLQKENENCKATAGLGSGLVVLVALICFVAGLLGFSLCQKYAGKHIK